MSRRIELLLSRKETFPINPSAPGCRKAKKGLEEEEELLRTGEGGRGATGGAGVCVCVYVTVCACTQMCACACCSAVQ